MKPSRPIKARRMWESIERSDHRFHATCSDAVECLSHTPQLLRPKKSRVRPVLVIATDPDSISALTAQLKNTLDNMGFNRESPLGMPIAETILTAIGITRRGKGK